MSKVMECAMSLVAEFHKAQYLDQVDEKNMRALALLLDKVLTSKQADEVLKALAKIDPALDISDVTSENIKDHPLLTKGDSIRLMFWSLAIACALVDIHMEERAMTRQEKTAVRKMEEEIREELHDADPAFARYVFGP